MNTDKLSWADIEGTQSRRRYRGAAKDLMLKYSSLNQSVPFKNQAGANRRDYNSFDYRDVTLVKHNGLDSPESEIYKPKINFGMDNHAYFNSCSYLDLLFL